jgi:hypothetical protein
MLTIARRLAESISANPRFDFGFSGMFSVATDPMLNRDRRKASQGP